MSNAQATNPPLIRRTAKHNRASFSIHVFFFPPSCGLHTTIFGGLGDGGLGNPFDGVSTTAGSSMGLHASAPSFLVPDRAASYVWLCPCFLATLLRWQRQALIHIGHSPADFHVGCCPAHRLIRSGLKDVIFALNIGGLWAFETVSPITKGGATAKFGVMRSSSGICSPDLAVGAPQQRLLVLTNNFHHHRGHLLALLFGTIRTRTDRTARNLPTIQPHIGPSRNCPGLASLFFPLQLQKLHSSPSHKCEKDLEISNPRSHPSDKMFASAFSPPFIHPSPPFPYFQVGGNERLLTLAIQTHFPLSSLSHAFRICTPRARNFRRKDHHITQNI
ncbi:hypothetical protein M433DRAFT_513979 [Acidomyces richmondensis BFW]|nr:MAG: hypothetical protein FE78DRAFT_322315 [Acidomyces sp. 'richmondensis']KYG47119.1 hypothetical protein M433DRAFT_513979 [Acidomyces richmondensis BFW]